MSINLSPTNNPFTICPTCKNEIDPDICWCGEYYKNHNAWHESHNFIPMGCSCYMEPEKIKVTNNLYGMEYDEGFLRIQFIDGDHCTIVGTYGDYTGESEGEYITLIGLADKDRENELEDMPSTTTG